MPHKLPYLFLLVLGVIFFIEKYGKWKSFNPISGKFYKAIIVLIIIAMGAAGVYDSLKYSHALSPIACPGCEKETILSGEVYAKEGFFSNAGLPYFSYNEARGRPVYTHIPPGPNWVGGVYTKICGSGNLGCFRLIPTTFGVISFFLFAWFLLSNLSPAKSAAMMVAVAFVPMSYNMLHGLHYPCYTNSLLLIQLGLLLSIFKGKAGIDKLRLISLFMIGFLQGYFTWEYYFVVSFAAIPLAYIYSPLKQTEDKKRLFFVILALFSGFSFAHLLHFVQVSVYLGGIKEGFLELMRAGFIRGGGEGLNYKDFYWDGKFKSSVMMTGFMDRFMLLKQYIFTYTKQDIFFDLSFPKLLLLTALLFMVKDASLIVRKPISTVLKWTSYKRYFIAVLAALLINSLWIIIMYDDSATHYFVIPRHFFLTYFICILAILESISVNDFIVKDN
jgi:hypothetical protein